MIYTIGMRQWICKGVYKEVSVDRNAATETQTPKSGREGRKVGRELNGNDRKPIEKLRDLAPT